MRLVACRCLSRGASLILAAHARPLRHPWLIAIQHLLSAGCCQ
jgi:hypothetical protein